MSFLEIFLIGLGLSMDCFAVSIGFGASRLLSWRDILKIAAYFGLFQGAMPVAGWFIGDRVKELIDSFDHWLAFGILFFIGMKMIVQTFRKEKTKWLDIRKQAVLISLSFATSIDALVTGVSFGFIRVNILIAVIIITMVTFLISILGMKIGERTTFIPARWAEFAGGLVLIAMGTKIALSHLGILAL